MKKKERPIEQILEDILQQMIEIIKDKSQYYNMYDTRSGIHTLIVLTEKELISLHTKIGKELGIKSYQNFVDEVEEDKRKFLGGFNYKGKK